MVGSTGTRHLIAEVMDHVKWQSRVADAKHLGLFSTKAFQWSPGFTTAGLADRVAHVDSLHSKHHSTDS